MEGVDGNYKLQVPDAKNLRERIFIIAHCGMGGHRGIDSTTQMIKELNTVLGVRQSELQSQPKLST